MRGTAWLAAVGGSLPMRMGALGVKKGLMGFSAGVRESSAGRNLWRNLRPGEAVGGMAS